MSADGHIVRMRPRTPITPEQVIEALEASGGLVEAAATYLRRYGIEVSGRTLYRRMREYGIKPTVRFIHEEAA